MTIAEKLATAIANQQAEVNRLASVATVDLPAAQAKLRELLGLAAKVTPGLETAFVTLKKYGIQLDT